MSEKANRICQRFESMASDRANFDDHWTEVAEKVLPSLKDEFQGRSYNQMTKGEERTEYQFDSTAQIALGRHTSILDSLLTPRNQTWHRTKVSNPELEKDRAVRLWFDEVNRLFFKYRYAPEANFASQNQRVYQSLGAFGNGVLFTDELQNRNGVRYKSVSLGGCYFRENHQGIIDSLTRHFRMTARQIVQKWGGRGTVPEKVMKAVEDSSKGMREFEILHDVMPREDVDPNRRDFRGMAFTSDYVLVDGKVMLEEGGYRTFPYQVARDNRQAPGEVYARSPAMEVLPAIRTINEQKKTVLKQGHRTVDPVLLAFDDGIAGRFSMRPGAFNTGAVTRDGRSLVQTLPVGNIAIGKDLMDDERRDINDAFLVTLFQILTESPRMTATEVLERAREKGILLAPSFGRIESEYLGSLIEREFDLLINQGLLPPMPPVLIEAQGEYKIEFDSPFSRAQRAEEAAGLMRVYEFALQVANASGNPSIMDHFDEDVIIPEIAHIQGLPEKWMRGQQQVAAMRAQRAQQQAVAQAQQLAPGAAALIKSAATAQEKAPELTEQALAAAGS